MIQVSVVHEFENQEEADFFAEQMIEDGFKVKIEAK